MKMNLKKILVAGAVLTAFCANAFAAEPAQQQPTMKEKVAAILNHHNDEHERPCPPEGQMKNAHRRGPKLTAEQRAEHKKLHDNWKNMTPEQRQQAKEKMRKDCQEAHDKYAKETMSKLTDEQRAQVEQFIKEEQARRDARRASLEKMTPEQREAVRANKPLPPKPPKDFKKFAKHQKGEFRGQAPQGGQKHPAEMNPAEMPK